jgi:hypothetical protein
VFINAGIFLAVLRQWEIKKPFKRLWLEGLHPVYLTLVYLLPGLCLSQSMTITKRSFLPDTTANKKERFSKVSNQWQLGKAGLLAPPPL